MKNFTLMTLITLALFSCGRNDDFMEDSSKKAATTSESAVKTSPDCTFLEVGENVEMTCSGSVILIPGNLLSSSKVESDKVTLKASRKNGGADGDKNYDLTLTLNSALDLELPSTIATTGNAGSDLKLYLKINNDIDCAYTSDGSGEFKNPHCYTGAVRDSTELTGFTGGIEEADLIIENILDIEMNLDSSSGDGVITTATAVLNVIP